VRFLSTCAVAALVLALSACGGSSSGGGSGGTGPSAAKLRKDVAKATHATAADFPATKGRTLQQIADQVHTGPKVGLGTSDFVVGNQRIAFGVLSAQNAFIYGPTALYVAPTPTSRAEGPYPAPADLLIADGPFRSQQSATEKDAFAGVYAAQVPLKKAGPLAILVVTKAGRGALVGAPTEVTVRPVAKDPVVRVGQQAPHVDTDTLSSVGGDENKLETRKPPSNLQQESFKDVVGKKPVALLFSTPQLCQSRVCGPVTDLALQLQKKYGDRMTFIHQEVYQDNDVNKGYRKPLQEFGLSSEPWLFTIRKDGTVAARLEGSFGINAFNKAIQAAL
jgi:hypothetical protein